MKAPSLTKLADYRKRGGRACAVCVSPHRKFIEQALAAGHSKRAVVEYLAEEFDAQLPSLTHHWIHHVKKT